MFLGVKIHARPSSTLRVEHKSIWNWLHPFLGMTILVLGYATVWTGFGEFESWAQLGSIGWGVRGVWVALIVVRVLVSSEIILTVLTDCVFSLYAGVLTRLPSRSLFPSPPTLLLSASTPINQRDFRLSNVRHRFPFYRRVESCRRGLKEHRPFHLTTFLPADLTNANDAFSSQSLFPSCRPLPLPSLLLCFLMPRLPQKYTTSLYCPFHNE